AKHRHDCVAGAHFARKPDRASDIDAGRGAEAEAFLFEELEDDSHGLLILDPPGMIDLDTFQILSDAALADAFGDRAAFSLQLARRVVAVERSSRRIGEANLDVLALGLQADRDAAERAAGANRTAEAIDLPLRLLPNLFGRRFDVCLPICDVIELVGPDRAIGLRFGELFSQPSGVLHIVVRVFVRDRGDLDQRGSEQTERVLLLLGLRFRDYDHRTEAHRSADDRQANAG